MKLPSDPLTWLHSIKLELKCDNTAIAQHLLARSLQACPSSGRLWALAIEMEPQATRLRKSTDAVNHAKTDPYVFIAIGKIFWVEKKLTKARKFFERATELEKDNGDPWLYRLALEKSSGDAANVQKVKADFLKADPKHGELWCMHRKKPENWRRDKFDLLSSIPVTLP